MKNVFLLIMLLSVGIMSGQQTKVNVIPQPVSMQVATGSFVLTPATVISYDKPEGQAVAMMLVQKLNVPMGAKLKAVQGKNGAVQFNLNGTPGSETG